MAAESRILARPDADIAYVVHRAESWTGEEPALLMIGQPMTSDGFTDLAAQFPERTVVTYDPRGLGASSRRDGSELNDPQQQAEDLHALIEELGGPVEIFASSGGAVAGLALLVAHPEDVRRLLAHEPPVVPLLPDAAAAAAVERAVAERYHAQGWGAGMAAFLAMASHQGELTEEVIARFPDPAQLGLPAEDDGGRDDPLLSGSSAPVTAYVPDLERLRAERPKIAVGVGEETGEALTARTSRALATRLGLEPVAFPGDHGGFHAGDPSHPGDPAAFADRLRDVLAARR